MGRHGITALIGQCYDQVVGFDDRFGRGGRPFVFLYGSVEYGRGFLCYEGLSIQYTKSQKAVFWLIWKSVVRGFVSDFYFDLNRGYSSTID